eukprot:GHVU01004110.1.p2 GENE.GHVU01004110.1~~GHVU01004110.1.p2  ORF type:complete len:102 (-),score=16.24 GHVU01004110.1:493-798(-)
MNRGRPKVSKNKITSTLKEAILQAADEAGGPEKLVGYLKMQAKDNPGPFMALLGKILPTQVTSDPDNPLTVVHDVVERVVVKPNFVDVTAKPVPVDDKAIH